MKMKLACFLLAAISLSMPSPSQIDSRSLATRAHAALAVTSGHLRVAGLQKPVRVLRDRWGVAHIYAENSHDLFFAQGVVASQDRLFQMELWKRSGQGRLAEILGAPALQRDIKARLLRYRGDMKAEYESYASDTRAILEAFTAGINAYISSLTASSGPGLPLEFQLAGFKPEPWKPEDCLNRMAAFSMTGNASSELYNAELLSKLGAEKASKLLDLDPEVTLDPAPSLDLTGLSPSLLKNLVGSDARIEFPQHAIEGSNNWTISGALTKTGKPLLANDPHRVIAEPSLRYMVHLVAPGWDVIGAGEPGLPGVALGHNQHIAWGFTIFGLDQQDLYLEELKPADPLQYKTESGWQHMKVERESFAVKGRQPVDVELKFTVHGPVLWEDGRRAVALRWVGSESGTAGYLASLAVDRAQDWADFESAMARWKVPSENIVYADTEGNIGEHSTGLAPIRKNWTGLLPVPGSGQFEWSGFVPDQELPHSFNPRTGLIATANQRMIPDGYPYHVGYEWTPPYRFWRISRVLSSARDKGHKLSTEDIERLQTDVLSLPALELIRLLRSAAGAHPDANAQLLLQWDGQLTRDSAAAAFYEVWMQELTHELVKKTAPETVWKNLEDWSLPLVIQNFSEPTQAVFGPTPTEARDRFLLETLGKAAAKLSATEGSAPEKLSWGNLHVVRFRHPLDQILGATLEQNAATALLDNGPLPRPGDDYTVNATGFAGSSYDQVSGASYREILDPGDWDRSLAINTPGQSGQPDSPHYSDLLPLWDEGRYFPLAYSRAAVEKETTERLVLEP